MTNIQNCIKSLEKLSLLTCSNEVLSLLERTLHNVQPILKVDTKGVEPLLWQNELKFSQLHDDKPNIKLTRKDLKSMVPNFHEDYIAIGLNKNKKNLSYDL